MAECLHQASPNYPGDFPSLQQGLHSGVAIRPSAPLQSGGNEGRRWRRFCSSPSLGYEVCCRYRNLASSLVETGTLLASLPPVLYQFDGSPLAFTVGSGRYTTPPSEPDHTSRSTSSSGQRCSICLELHPAHVLQVSHWERAPNVPAAWHALCLSLPPETSRRVFLYLDYRRGIKHRA